MKYVSTRMVVLITAVIVVIILVSIIMIVANPFTEEASGESTVPSPSTQQTPQREATPTISSPSESTPSTTSSPIESTPYSPSNTTSINPGKILVFQDAVFYGELSPDGTRMTISLYLMLKNEGDRKVYITRIEVPDLNWITTITDVVLNPGDTWSNSFIVAKDMPYTIEWETGTKHTILVYFKVEGHPEEMSVGIKAVVM